MTASRDLHLGHVPGRGARAQVAASRRRESERISTIEKIQIRRIPALEETRMGGSHAKRPAGRFLLGGVDSIGKKSWNLRSWGKITVKSSRSQQMKAGASLSGPKKSLEEKRDRQTLKAFGEKKKRKNRKGGG